MQMPLTLYALYRGVMHPGDEQHVSGRVGGVPMFMSSCRTSAMATVSNYQTLLYYCIVHAHWPVTSPQLR